MASAVLAPGAASGLAKGAAEEAGDFHLEDKQCLCVPCGRNTVTVGSTEIKMARLESPCNIACCGARMHQASHWGNVKVLHFTRGMRLCSTLLCYLLYAAALGAVVGLAQQRSASQDTQIYSGVGAGAGLFLLLALVWFCTRSAFFSYSLGGVEADPMRTLVAGAEGLRVSHLTLEAAVEAAWRAWASFRGAAGYWRPVAGLTTPGAEGHLSTLSHKQCLIPCGSDTLSLLHQRHVLIRKSAGCCNLDLCAGATWEGFWRCVRAMRGGGRWGGGGGPLSATSLLLSPPPRPPWGLCQPPPLPHPRPPPPLLPAMTFTG
jgi:hypothetical protein